jgi:hypothetical protein
MIKKAEERFSKAKISVFLLEKFLLNHRSGNRREELLFLNCLKKAVSFVSENAFLDELSLSENAEVYDSLLVIGSGGKFPFLTKLSSLSEKRLSESIYDERKDYYSKWSSSYYDVSEQGRFGLLYKYIIKNDVAYSDFVEFLSNLNKSKYRKDKEALRAKEVLFGVKNKDTYIGENYPVILKGMKDYERGAYHSGYIATGKADKKFIRKMRSESSGVASLMALRTLVEFKDSYSDFDTLLSLFNDSTHQDVVDFLTDYYSKDKIMYLIGNPLANKKKIEYKLMSE